MREIKAMTKRNLLIYFRNKSAVFFSILSALILLAIMVVFLGESSSEGLLDALNQYGTGTAEENAKNASWLVQLWIMGGILGINSVTVSLTAIGAMVEDEERGRLRSFYVTPASRFYLSLGYILSAWVSGMLTVAGTLVGFLGGTYIPVASMSEWLQNVVKLLPVIHGTALMRRFCMQSASKTVFAGMSDTVQTVFFEQMGVTLKNGAQTISILGQILLLIAWAVVVIAIAAAIAKRRKLKDR